MSNIENAREVSADGYTTAMSEPQTPAEALEHLYRCTGPCMDGTSYGIVLAAIQERDTLTSRLAEVERELASEKADHGETGNIADRALKKEAALRSQLAGALEERDTAREMLVSNELWVKTRKQLTQAREAIAHYLASVDAPQGEHPFDGSFAELRQALADKETEHA